MKLSRTQIVATLWAFVLLAAVLTGPAGAYAPAPRAAAGAAPKLINRQDRSDRAFAAPTVTAAPQPPDDDSISDPIDARQTNSTGDIIRQRVFRTAITGAVIAASALLLLWGYITLRDPIRRYQASMRMRKLRREERKSRTRQRRRQ